jgi:ribonuclease J
LNFIIHRGTHQIGGSCVEVRSGEDRILLDLGLPLTIPGDDAQPVAGQPVQALLSSGVLPHIAGVYAGDAPEVRAVIISHVHQDHMGLANFVHPDIPVYATEGAWALTEALSPFLPARTPIANQRTMPMKAPQKFGALTVTAIPVDHSAPDATALLVEEDGTRLLYTGDLRAHGRKGYMFTRLIRELAGTIGTLIVEGTTIGRPDHEPVSEESLEPEFMRLFTQQPHMTLVFCSAQNLDRIVTVNRAVKQTDKTMVIDLYTAFTLHKLACLSANLPQWHWPEIQIAPWMYQQQRLNDAGHGEFVESTRPKWTNMRTMQAQGKDTVLLMRSNRKMASIETALGDESRQVQVVWSMWDGYWAEDVHARLFCEKYGIKRDYVHTSGHASWSDLKRLIEGINPVDVVPIHTEHASVFEGQFSNVILPADGASVQVSKRDCPVFRSCSAD